MKQQYTITAITTQSVTRPDQDTLSQSALELAPIVAEGNRPVYYPTDAGALRVGGEAMNAFAAFRLGDIVELTVTKVAP